MQEYAREWGTGDATGEWYGDVVVDGSYKRLRHWRSVVGLPGKDRHDEAAA